MSMRTRYPSLVLALAGASLVACASVGRPAEPISAPSGGAIEVRLEGPAVGGYRTQAEVKPYKAADVKTIVVSLYFADSDQLVVNGAATASIQLGTGEFGRTLTFANLRHDTTYRIKGFAYKGSVCCSAFNLISKDSHVDVAVGTDDRPALASLTIALQDTLFSGEASTSLSLTEGDVIYQGLPGMTIATPPAPVDG